MSAERPLVLVLEDLQWVDRAALDVLSALARRRQPARLLVLGTYRPADVAHGGHPLRGLKHDLVLHRLGHDIALQPLDAAWVRRRLEQELGSTAIGGAVTSFVLRYSDGNPLFVDAIIQHLRTHGLLCLQHGFWTQKGALDGQTGLPAALAQLFELQAGQLPAGDQQLLETASVAGRAFSARMIADALDEGVEPVEERLEHLAAARQFIHRVSEGRDALSPTLYGFEHALVREALSRKVPPTRRGRLLARMASARDGGPRAIAAAGS